MYKWKHLFEDKILTRGYYYTDFVKITERSKNHVKAIVRGTFDYHTEIRFMDGLIDEMSCSCPYFHTDNCKHLAALLYCLEENHNYELDVGELLNSVGEDDLREFLLYELENDYGLLNRFQLKFTNKINPEYYRNKLSEISLEDDNRHSIDDFIKDDLNYLVSKNEYELVLELADELFSEIRRWWGYWEDYGSNTDMCEFEKVLEKLVNTKVHEDLFYWLSNLINNYADDSHISELKELYFRCFTNPEELEFKHDLVMKLTEKTENIEWVNHRIKLMESLNYSENEIKKLMEYYSYDSGIIQRLIDSSDGSEKEEYLKKAIKQFEYNEEFRVQLKNNYRIYDYEKYLNELENLVFSYNNIEYYKEFKNTYAGDWVSKRREIFKKHDDLNEYYAYEGLYDLLIDNIKTIDELDYYMNVLMKDYSDDLFEKYSGIVYSMAQKSGSPKHYENIAEILKTMKKIPDCEEKVCQIVDYFKNEYKRRPRMLQALRQAGF